MGIPQSSGFIPGVLSMSRLLGRGEGSTLPLGRKSSPRLTVLLGYALILMYTAPVCHMGTWRTVVPGVAASMTVPLPAYRETWPGVQTMSPGIGSLACGPAVRSAPE